jgi:hypothetical protein
MGMTRRKANGELKGAVGTPAEAKRAHMLNELVHEQRQTNKMLWAMLTEEQREAFRQMP